MRFDRYFIILFYYFLFNWSLANAQDRCFFEHYGIENGLPQNSVMDILQDKKGFMWFSTWDGLCYFDGYDFETIEIPNRNDLISKSSRIDSIYEDSYGNIWAHFYDKYVLRYNPSEKSFKDLRDVGGLDYLNFDVSKLKLKENGEVWLLSDDAGCVCIQDSTFSSKVYNVANGTLINDSVYDIFRDSKFSTWILTNEGVVQLDKFQNSKIFFNQKSSLMPKESFSIYCANEIENEVWFGGDDGVIWIYSYDKNSIRSIKTKTKGKISKIESLKTNEVIVLTKDDGFLIYDLYDGNNTQYNSYTNRQLKSNNLLSSFTDKSGNIWIETEEVGVVKFNPFTKELKYFKPNNDENDTNVSIAKFIIFEDIDGRLWVHPKGGGFSYYDAEYDVLIPFHNRHGNGSLIFSNTLHSAYSDRQGNLWLGTRSKGLEKVTFIDKNFKLLELDSIVSTTNNDVRAVFQLKDGSVWISTKDGKIHVYSSNLEKIGCLDKNGRITSDSEFGGIAYCFMQDSRDNIWIGTKGEGVFKFNKDENKLYSVAQYKSVPGDVNSISSNNIYSIYEDSRGRIWIGTYGGGINLVVDNNYGITFVNKNNLLSNYPYDIGSKVRVVSEDKWGNIFVGSTMGLIAFPGDFIGFDSILYSVFHKNDSDYSIKSNDVYDVKTTKTGETYVIAFGGGISKVSEVDEYGLPLKFKTYTVLDGLPSNVLLTALEDSFGNIIICAEASVVKFNPDEQSFEIFSDVKRMMRKQNFSEGSICRLNDGVFLVGSSMGVLYFDEHKLINNTYSPYLALVDFKLFNKEVNVGISNILRESIDDIDNLRLKYNQNFFAIEFAALDYKEPNNINYAYQLEGFDKNWIYNNEHRIANYTNLSHGKYKFKVRSTNSDGLWSDNERTIYIEILPPIWQTWWAYMIYFILLILIVYFIFRVFVAFYSIRQQAELENRELQLKTKFFTDISHEIRTPLTMIVSPIENLIRDNETPVKIKKQLSMVSNNTERLLTMVNQILDFRKIENKSIEVRRVVVGKFVANICEVFFELAEKNNINFEVVDNTDGDEIWVDPDAFEKILINVISNAFKFTPNNKSIQVVTSVKDEYVNILIADEGIGIAKEYIGRVFKRFESFNENKDKPSTGIGLFIVKELMDKHKAKIVLNSELGRGTTFNLILKKGISHYGSDIVINNEERVNDLAIAEEAEVEVVNNDCYSEIVDEKLTILIVEDDDDLREFIVLALEEQYNVEQARNGKEGLLKVEEMIPDFIISDIMMPEMNGIEMLSKIRENPNTSHILFLLLTAKTTDSDIVLGLESGTDEYMTKPFSVTYLRTKINSLINRRKVIQDFYRTRSEYRSIVSVPQYEKRSEDDSFDMVVNKQDEDFINNVREFVKANMSDMEYVVDDIAAELNMSRTVFYKKVKSLTGLSPIEFKRDILLDEAANILKDQQHTVKDVSYMVGFSDAKYFSRCFKSKFEVTPSDYMRRFR